MKIAPVSADLLIKLALVAAGIGLAVYLVKRSTTALADAAGNAVNTAFAAVGDVADGVIVGVNPYNPGNWVNQGVSAVGSTLVSDNGPGRNADGSWTVGGWLYDVTHPDPVASAGSASGSTPIVDGGAAFGWFPHLGRGTPNDVQIIANRGRVVGGL